MVSVYCTTYNHEKYIRKALDSFVNQKTNFRYEVLIHDDASTDNTPNIIKEYAVRYPDVIKPIFQKENQRSKNVKIVREYIWPLMKGKYVAVCEGDDFWTDENKLQLQFDAMELHPECVMCSHFTELYSMDKHKVMRTFPNQKHKLSDGIISGDLQFDLVFELFHLSSDFFRKDIYDEYQENNFEYSKVMKTGDRALLLYFMNRGDFYFLARTMSRYNKGTEGSYTQRIERDKVKNIEKDEANLKALILFKEICSEKWIKKLEKQIDVERWNIEVLKYGYGYYLRKENRYKFKQMKLTSKIRVLLGIVSPQLVKKLNDLRGWGE